LKLAGAIFMRPDPALAVWAHAQRLAALAGMDGRELADMG